MIKFDLRLNPETVEQIKQAAYKDSRTVSAMARKILEDYFKPKDKVSVDIERTTKRVDDIISNSKDMTAFFAERNKNK